MKVLLVGKTGVFETLAAAVSFIDEMDIRTCSYFGDLAIENSKRIIRIGQDSLGNEVFAAGYKDPEIIVKTNQDLESLSNINYEEHLEVIPVSVRGENFTLLLSKIAAIPLIGTVFLNWAKARTLSRLPYLTEYGNNIKRNLMSESQPPLAAKPFINQANS